MTAYEEGSCGQGARLPHGSCKPVPAATCPSYLPPPCPSICIFALQTAPSERGLTLDSGITIGPGEARAGAAHEPLGSGTCQAREGLSREGALGAGGTDSQPGQLPPWKAEPGDPNLASLSPHKGGREL